jgi:hypothetical protein
VEVLVPVYVLVTQCSCSVTLILANGHRKTKNDSGSPSRQTIRPLCFFVRAGCTSFESDGYWCQTDKLNFKYNTFERSVKHTRTTTFKHMLLLESCVYSACMTYTIAVCTLNKLLMMGRGTVRNM